MLEFEVWVAGKEGKAIVIRLCSNKTKSTVELIFLLHLLRCMSRHMVVLHNLVNGNGDSFAY